MCTYLKQSKVNEAICYKVVTKKGNKYYSFYAETRLYKNGNISKINKVGKNRVEYKSEIKGLITAYKFKKDAKECIKIKRQGSLFENWQNFNNGKYTDYPLALLKIKLSEIVYTGITTDDIPIYIGSKILSMEEVK